MTSTSTLTPPRHDTTALAALVREVAAQPDLWRPHVRFGTAGRYWTRLESPDGVDVWLLTWLPSQGTDLHDHGDSSAAFAVVRGALTEVRTDERGGAAALRSAVVRAPAVRVVEPGVVHDVRNDLVEPAVSIHAYSPRLTRMTFYDLDAGALAARAEVLGDEPEVAS